MDQYDPRRGMLVARMVSIVVPCAHCGDVSKVSMSPDDARRYAHALLASADDFGRVCIGRQQHPQG